MACQMASMPVTLKVKLACNFNCLIDIEGVLKVTGSHVHCKSGNVSETVQDRDVAAANHKWEVICDVFAERLFQ